MQMIRSKLKTGMRRIRPNIRSFKEDELLFKEGDRGREMFVIQEGEIRITRGEKAGEVELARLKPGSILGEMSLLDNLPRSATATATQPSKAVIVTEQVFNAVLQRIPPWLVSIVRIITSRIRDANRRVGQSILRNKEAGVASLLYLLLRTSGKSHGSRVYLEYEFVILEVFYSCRLGRKATQTVLEGLVQRGLCEIEVDEFKKKCIFFLDLEYLALFVEYHRLKERGRTFPELDIPENEVDMLNNITYVAQKSGKESKEGTELPMKAFMEDMAQKNVEGIEQTLAGLQRRDIITIMPGPDGSDNLIFFQKETLTRIRNIKEGMPKFEMDLTASQENADKGPVT